ncbi:hypothetical protein JQX13_20250 [Archangium violaceum]|uniref:hypothetical protein n=1 Tax=Archangium violaceum TaxID=83451 RepID=UPI00193BF4BC|nr:hypothetical protein [Archangium violaceum]QRK12164.1 hypothetical protein JQX13_20250 [Archangium violaceum]
MGTFLDLILREFRWFEPRRHGSVALDKPIDPSRIDMGALVAHYEEYGTLFVAARTDRDFISIHPITTGAPPYTGSISWMTSASLASKASWRASHTKQVREVMRLFQVPLALSGLKTDLHSKQWRFIPKSIPMEGGKEFTYSEQVLTVPDYSKGLAGLVWRNFYGPPFVRMFGERLDTLPPECRKTLGEELVLVQPYELPTDAGTEAGIARERELITLLGPECFYDHEHHTLPTRRPVLNSLGQPLH